MAKLFVNDNGTVRRLRRLFVNDNGVVRELKTLYTSVAGVIQKIFDYTRTWRIDGQASSYVEGLKEIVDFGIDSDFNAGQQQREIVDFGVPNNFTSGGVSEVFDIGIDEDFNAGISGRDYIDLKFGGSFSGHQYPLTWQLELRTDSSTSFIGVSSNTFFPGNASGNPISDLVNAIFDAADSESAMHNEIPFTPSKVGTDTVRLTFDKAITWGTGSLVRISILAGLAALGDNATANNVTMEVLSTHSATSFTGTHVDNTSYHSDIIGYTGNYNIEASPAWTSGSMQLNNTPASYSISGTDLGSTITGNFEASENATQARTRITNALNGNSGFAGVWNTGTAMTVSGNLVTRFTADSAGDKNAVTLSVTANSGSNTTPYNNVVTTGSDAASYSVSGSFLENAITGDFPDGDTDAAASRDALKAGLQASTEFTNEFEFVKDTELEANTVTRWQSKTDTDYTPYTYSVTANGGSNATAYLNVVQNGGRQASYSIHAEGIPVITGSFTPGANATQARIDLRNALSGDSEFNAVFEHAKDTEILSTYRDTETFATRHTDFTFDVIGNNEWALSSSRIFVSNVNFSDWDDWVGNFLTYNRLLGNLEQVRQIRVSIGNAVAVFEARREAFSNQSFEIISITGQSGAPVSTDTELRLELHDIGKKITRFESRTDSDQAAFTYTTMQNDGEHTTPYLSVAQDGEAGDAPTVISITSPNESISLTMGTDADSVGQQIADSSVDITYDAGTDLLSTPGGTNITVSNPNTLTITRTED